MTKTLFAAAAILGMGAPALAGPYPFVNVEANSGFTGSDYQGTTTETHVGFAGDLGDSADFSIQGGPAFVSPDGEDATTELSGKVNLGVDITDRFGVYGEISAMTNDSINFDEDLDIGTKIGATYRF